MARTSVQAREMLAVVTPETVEVVRRVRAPFELNEEQREVFQEIVSQCPADHFVSGHLTVLAQFCRHITMARRLAELIDKAMADPDVTPARMEQLRKSQHQESAMLCRMATHLRLTPQSITPNRASVQRMHEAENPWAKYKAEIAKDRARRRG